MSERREEILADPARRNVRFGTGILTVAVGYQCEHRTIIDWPDGDVESWSEGGGVFYEEPTVERVRAWLAVHEAAPVPPRAAE